MRLVLDTNVLVSALLSPVHPPALILDTILIGENVLLYDERLMAEYRGVLTLLRFGFDPTDVGTLLEFFQTAGERVICLPSGIVLKDPDDLPFYEVALSGRADFLVTGNKKHFPRAPWIVSPAEFWSQGQR